MGGPMSDSAGSAFPGKLRAQHQARGEWMDTWRVDIDPGQDGSEGFRFRLSGCPMAKRARENGYADLLPYLCRTDHFLAELMHARLIRTQTEALGGQLLRLLVCGG